MQIRPHEKVNIIKTGIFVSIMLIIIATTIFVLGKERTLFDKKTHYHTNVENAQNLRIGSFIQFKGIKIGTVDKIAVVSLETIRISFSIKSTMSTWVKDDSFMMFRTQGVLGDKFLEILGGTPSSKIKAANSSIVTKAGVNLEKFLNKGEDIIVTAARVLNKLDNILTAIDINAINETIVNINKSSLRTKELLYSINPKHIKSTLSNLSHVTGKIRNGSGTINSLIYDKALYQQINSLLGGANRSKVLKYFIRESIEDSEK